MNNEQQFHSSTSPAIVGNAVLAVCKITDLEYKL